MFTQELAFEKLSKQNWWDRTAFAGKARKENSYSGSISKYVEAFCPSLLKSYTIVIHQSYQYSNDNIKSIFSF